MADLQPGRTKETGDWSTGEIRSASSLLLLRSPPMTPRLPRSSPSRGRVPRNPSGVDNRRVIFTHPHPPLSHRNPCYLGSNRGFWLVSRSVSFDLDVGRTRGTGESRRRWGKGGVEGRVSRGVSSVELPSPAEQSTRDDPSITTRYNLSSVLFSSFPFCLHIYI